jgi:uncharacterized membrane protein YoaK (UPF0700 family)
MQTEGPTPTTALKDFRGGSFFSVVAWASILCFNGGFVNGVSVAGVFRIGLTHMTGITTTSAKSLLIWPQAGQIPAGAFYGFIVAFLLGAMTVGILMGGPDFKWGNLQGFCMLLEALALFIGWYLAPRPVGGWFLSYSMGIQNAISSNFSGGALRTSHVSGTVLDAGLALGQCIRLRNMTHFWKVKVHVPNWACFWLGSLAGTAVYNIHDKDAYLLSFLFALIVGIWTIFHNSLDRWLERRGGGERLFDSPSSTAGSTEPAPAGIPSEQDRTSSAQFYANTPSYGVGK